MQGRMPLNHYIPTRLVTGLAIIGVMLVLADQLPRWFAATPGMVAAESSHFVVWHENTQRRPALYLRTLLEDRGSEALLRLGFELPEGELAAVWLYPDRASYRIHLGGLAGLGGAELPGPPTLERGRILSYFESAAIDVAGIEREARAVLQLFIIEILNQKVPSLSAWARIGLAGYLSGAEIADEDGLPLPVPDMLYESDELTVIRSGGRQLADSFFAWIEYRGGAAALKTYISMHGDLQSTVGLDVYGSRDAWGAWMRAGRPDDPRLAYPRYDLREQ